MAIQPSWRTMQKVRMGVIGAGWWATQFHIPSLKTYAKSHLVGIADLKPDKLARAAEYYDIENGYQDHRELLASGIVITRHGTVRGWRGRGLPSGNTIQNIALLAQTTTQTDIVHVARTA